MRLSTCVVWLFFATSALADPYRVTVSAGGATMHSSDIDPQLAEGMPHRIDDNGRYVYHPVEMGITVNHKIWQYNGFYLKDSFDRPAMFLGGGVAVPFPFKNLMLGGTAGIYAREVEYFKTSKGDMIEVDCGDYCLKTDTTQIFPTAFLTAAYTWPIQDSTYFTMAVATNYVLTHLTFGIQYRFGQ